MRVAGEAGPEARPAAPMRWAWAEVDVDAVRHNAGVLERMASPARVCAVVKADAYGHGAVTVARAALDGGARWLAVALVEEGVELREAGIEARVLLLSEPAPDAMEAAAANRLTPTVYTERGVSAAAAAARATRQDGPLAVHVKVDTGMHRVGADPDDALKVARLVDEAPELHLEGLWTHLAVAEAPDDPFTGTQLQRFEVVADQLGAAGVRPPLVHAANSAAAICHPEARMGLVRCGISLYGYAPSQEVEAEIERRGERLLAVLSLRSRVCHVRRLPAGERISYGRLYELQEPSVVAVVPLGYADGVPRRLYGAGGEVLVGGRRRPIAGEVTMDQLVADCGPGSDVAVGDEVVLIGEQGSERIGADEWARKLGTISYEILTGIGARVPRVATGARR